MPGWVVCKGIPPDFQSESGLFIAKDPDKEVRTEGVAEVLSYAPKRGMERAPLALSPGDKIIYRGFLRYANQVGEVFEADKGCDFFLLSIDDVLAIVEGSGTLGAYGEFKI
jgi:co-chaperonin GroES (HSP10)